MLPSRSKSSLPETPNSKASHSALNRSGLSETPNKTTPATPRVSKLARTPSKAESADSPSPLQSSRPSVDCSPRSVESKPAIERRSPKIVTPTDQKYFGEGANMPEQEVEQSVGGDRCGKGSGLVITMNEPISSFLLSAPKDPHLPHELQELASDLSLRSSLPYRSLIAVWFSSLPSTRPPLRLLFSGSGFVFESPKPREKSEELKERLRKLSEMEERKAYQELVRDIMPKEPAEPFSSYKDQLGFGLHVLLVMFTGYLVGFAAFRALFNHSSIMVILTLIAYTYKNAAGGILGLVCGMLLETVLFIIRTSNRDIVSSSTAAKLKKNQ